MVEYLLEDRPKTPFLIKHVEEVSITLAILVAVVVGVHFWDSIDADKKFPFVMGVTAGTMFLIERFLAATCNYLDV